MKELRSNSIRSGTSSRSGSAYARTTLTPEQPPPSPGQLLHHSPRACCLICDTGGRVTSYEIMKLCKSFSQSQRPIEPALAAFGCGTQQWQAGWCRCCLGNHVTTCLPPDSPPCPAFSSHRLSFFHPPRHPPTVDIFLSTPRQPLRCNFCVGVDYANSDWLLTNLTIRPKQSSRNPPVLERSRQNLPLLGPDLEETGA